MHMPVRTICTCHGELYVHARENYMHMPGRTTYAHAWENYMYMSGRTICTCLVELCVHARDYLCMPEKMACMIIISLREMMLDFYSNLINYSIHNMI